MEYINEIANNLKKANGRIATKIAYGFIKLSKDILDSLVWGTEFAP
jgi:hypothetical protein